jgi:chromosome segregation ATPase
MYSKQVYYVLSSVEEITGEMKRLILKCRSLESKLEQSVPKKAYQDAIAKLQANIDKLSEDLQRNRDELGRTESLGGRLNNLSTVVLTLSNQISAQNEVIKSMTEKYQIPQEIHNKALSKIKDLESSISKRSTDAEAARARIAELETRLSESVPNEKYTKLMDQISGLVSFTVENSLLVEPQVDHHEIPGESVLNNFPSSHSDEQILSRMPEIQAPEKVETTSA